MQATGEAIGERQAEGGVAWRPAAEQWRRSRLARFVERTGCRSADDLRQRAAGDPAWFWQAAIEELGIEWSRPPSTVLDLSAGKPWAKWFAGAGFNYTTAAIDRWARSERGGAAALIWEGEDGARRELSYAQLEAEVGRAANALTALGVRRGERVGGFMPPTLRGAPATLACGRGGA